MGFESLGESSLIKTRGTFVELIETMHLEDRCTLSASIKIVNSYTLLILY